jgi:hypothetical protein
LIQSSLVKTIQCYILNHYTIPIQQYPNGLIYSILQNSDNSTIPYCTSIDKFGIGNQTNELYSKYHSQINKILLESNIAKNSPYHFHSKLYDIHFIPIKIIKTIENKYNHRHDYKCTDGINTLLFIVYTKSNNPNQYFKKINKLGIFGLALMKSQNISAAEISITIWMTSHNKKMKHCIHNCYLGTDEINSGCTIRRIIDDWGSIYIWRKEELEKVFIHELIHALQLDFYEYPTSLDKSISYNFNIKTSMRLNIFEAYTELWACLLNIIMNCILTNTIDDISKYITYEREWSMLQIKHILHYFKLFHFKNKDFFCIECSTFDKPPLFSQKTNVFSYFILKTFFMGKLDDFLSICNMYNTNYIKFNIPFDKLNDFINKMLEDDSIIHNIDKYRSHSSNNSISLKMTVCQFK